MRDEPGLGCVTTVMLWNLGVKRIAGQLQFHADRVVRFGAATNGGLVDRLSLILHPSLAGGSGGGTYPLDGAIRPLSLRAGSVTAEGAVLSDYRRH